MTNLEAMATPGHRNSHETQSDTSGKRKICATGIHSKIPERPAPIGCRHQDSDIHAGNCRDYVHFKCTYMAWVCDHEHSPRAPYPHLMGKRDVTNGLRHADTEPGARLKLPYTK